MAWRQIAAGEINKAIGNIVRLDLPSARVQYDGSKLKLHRELNDITGPEEVARAFLVHRLVNELGYKPELIEIEREYEAGRPKKIAPRIDLILRDGSGDAFFFVEVKEPASFESDKEFIEGQLFKLSGLHQAETGKAVRYLVFYTVEEKDGALIDKAIIIDHEAYPTYKSWIDAGEPSIGNTLTAKYNKPKKEPLIKLGARDLTKSFALKEVRALAVNLHNVLWGGGSTGDTDVFSALVNLILAKIQDEYDTQNGQEYKFQVIQQGDELEKTDELFARINGLYRTALRTQLNKQGDLADQWVVNKEKFSLSKVLFTVGQLEKYSFVDGKNSLTGKDILGDFFEQIQRGGFKQTKGQFFTPVNVVRFMLYALELDSLALDLMNKENRLPYVIDPSCGSATFLIESMKLITNEVKRRRRSDLSTSRMVMQRFDELFQPDYHEHKWAREYLYGIEHNFELATASKVNMILHGDGSSNIFQQDGLKPFRFYTKQSGPNVLCVSSKARHYQEKEINAQFDLVVSNPPFSVSLEDETKRFLVNEFMFGRKKNSENLFLERYWQLLKDGGRMAVILPESVFDTTENRYIRLFLFAYFEVIAVVSLPKVAFEPYTQTKTSILFGRKKSAAAIESWWSAWHKHSAAYGKLKTRVENYLKVFVSGESRTRFSSIKADDEDTVRENVETLLQVSLSPDQRALDLKELLKSYEILIAEMLAVDGDINDPFGAVNVSWVFREVVSELDRSIFVAEAGGVGYKRTKRGVRLQPNDLFKVEVAPAKLDLAAVKEAMENEIELLQSEVGSISARIAAIGSKARKGKKDDSEIARQTERQERLREEIRKAQERSADIEANVFACYDSKGDLRPEHKDRQTPSLLDGFKYPVLSQWRSEEIMVSSASPQTILEEMRAKKLWARV